MTVSDTLEPPGPELPDEPAAAGPRPDARGADGWTGRVLTAISEAGPAGWISFTAVSLSMLLVALTMGGGLLLEDSTTTGGDMGSHVWGPAFLRDHLLPDFRIAGWAPDWYAGFPAYRFYMVVPALAVVLLDVVLPYNVAFKLVSVSGVVAMPLASR